MKKILSLLLIVIALVSLVACAKEPNASGAGKLVYGERYISLDGCEPDHNFYTLLIEKDAIYKYVYYEFAERVYHCTITYKYEIIENGKLAYFYDSFETHEGNNAASAGAYNQSSGILSFSKNVLSSLDGESIYVRESYFNNELPNFGK